MDKTPLHKIGVTNNETEIYLLLIKLKEALASEIAGKCHISRPHVYDSLNRLIDKGLVSYVVKSGRRYFRGAPPTRLIDYIKEKEADLKSQEQEIRKILPQLFELQEPEKIKPSVEIYEGIEGLKTILGDIIKTKKDVLMYNVSDKLEKEFPIIIKKFKENRKRDKISARIICLQGSAISINKSDKVKFIPKENYSPSPTIIYGNKIAMILWSEPILTVLTKDREVAESHRNYFELMWQQKTRTFYGREGFAAAWEDMLAEGKNFIGFVGKDGAREDWRKLYPDLFDKYHAERIKRKIKVRVIVAVDRRNFKKELYNMPYSYYKFAPQGFAVVGGIYVYGNKVSVWSTAKEPIITIIESKELSKSYREQFNLIWDISK